MVQSPFVAGEIGAGPEGLEVSFERASSSRRMSHATFASTPEFHAVSHAHHPSRHHLRPQAASVEQGLEDTGPSEAFKVLARLAEPDPAQGDFSHAELPADEMVQGDILGHEVAAAL